MSEVSGLRVRRNEADVPTDLTTLIYHSLFRLKVRTYRLNLRISYLVANSVPRSAAQNRYLAPAASREDAKRYVLTASCNRQGKAAGPRALSFNLGGFVDNPDGPDI